MRCGRPAAAPGMEQLQGATPIVPGVAMGGFGAASLLVASGGVAPDQFRFFSRYCGWCAAP